MNGCTFLTQKGEELKWDHSKLFPYFKSKIEPFLINVGDSCFNMLDFFHSIRNYNIELTEEIEKNYEIFIDIYHYQQFIEVQEEIIAPIEVQLMWIVHCLNPTEYYMDCYRKYKKLLDVNINPLSFMNAKNEDEIPYLNEFEDYVKEKLSKNVLERISSISTTVASNILHEIDINENPQNWFIRHLNMKNSILSQIKFMNKINYIQSYHAEFKRFNQREIYKAMHRYLKFLYLMALPMNKRPLICIPTIDIELIWHSHILNINDYHAMSSYLCPDIDIIPYNYNICSKNKAKTQQIWNTIFGDDDYLQGRPFYIGLQQKHTKQRKKEYELKRPKPPIVLQVPDGRYPVTCSVPSQSPASGQTSSYLITPIPDTAYDERDFGEDDDGEEIEIGYGEQKNIEPLEIEAADTKSEDTKSEIGNCCYTNCELCADCCLWTFKTHRNENICIICGIIICVGLIIAMIGGLIFSSMDDGINNNVIVNVYKNNIIINKDSTITINSLIVWDLEENKQFNFQKSISYQIDNIATDIIDFNAGYDDYNNYFVGEPYLNNDTNGNNDDDDHYYYIDMAMNGISKQNTKSTVNFNYTLSSSYFCCTNNECDEIGLFMPWINKWQYPSNIQQVDITIFYQDLNTQIYSSWDDRNIKKERTENGFYLSTNNIDRDKNFNLYFKLLDNDTMNLNVGNTQKRCNEQIKYFIYDQFVYKENETHSTMTSNDFFFISLLTILFIACSCYGCWWIMYFLDNSFFCDLCDII